MVAMVNDTVGTMMTCAYEEPTCEIGLIVGECFRRSPCLRKGGPGLSGETVSLAVLLPPQSSVLVNPVVLRGSLPYHPTPVHWLIQH